MKRSTLVLLCCLAFSGCTASRTDNSRSVGDYSRGTTPAQIANLAADAVRQLSLLSPPAATRLEFTQPTADSFGKSLVEALRARGYAVNEQPAQASAGMRPAPSASVTSAAAAPGGTLRIGYLVDQIPDPAIVRVTLFVGTQSVTRGYLARGEAMNPVGAWLRKE
ncbi:MAG: conjugal transfer protein TrbH [Burkholderiaceae bacterium]|nr:conjugal transfer protein TrbH [Burkholderiaceae bacterium]